MRLTALAAAATLAFAPLPALADSHEDEITATLQSAMDAYADGDIQYALDELAYAQQLLNGLVAEGLQAYLPEPLDGWTMTIDQEAGQGMAFMGGGTIARGEYTGPGRGFTITLMADNPMVTSMGAMLGNSQMMASMGQIVRINRQSFLNQDGNLSALVGNRILIQAEDGDTDTMQQTLESMDFREMMSFGM
ncbi:hypothetical protein [Nioella nitratireducens]|uniref:hypothetical protein n=1 Tax=Nioella nitratireducens TaxID=1287720 RepID=UPI0008FD1F7F|nr:hypothetical protein [Nioella nitratireducens]